MLDVGFGDGRFLDQATAVGWECAGIEIAHAAARGVAGRHAVAVAPLDAVVDAPVLEAVTFWDVLEHLAEPAVAVRNAALRLRVGGLLAASMPSLSSVTARIEGSGWRYYDLDTYGHLVHMTPRHLRRLFEAEGLHIVHLETRGSVDLRHSLWASRASRGDTVGAVLDRLSGLVARVAVPRGFGNTILVVG
ncbi:MAG: class I SAM-dependent methyltransferase, partial [Gemmatimonadota bacterium]|nr:class I SAM-dependent methyltransferase [Gemmatimonadota bacterium]